MLCRCVLAVLVLLSGFVPPVVAWATDAVPAAHALPQWRIDRGQSHLGFEASEMGKVFEGDFGKFDGMIAFDPAAPERGHAEIVIHMASIDLHKDDRNRYAADAAWLDTESFPESRYVIDSFEKTEENQYVAKGRLTIRDVTLPVELPFSLRIAAGEDGSQRATAEGEVTIHRLDFGVGQGDWSDTDVVGNAFKVRVFLVAQSLAAP